MDGFSDHERRCSLVSVSHFFARHAEGYTFTGSIGTFIALRRRQMEPFVCFDAGFRRVHLSAVHAAAVVPGAKAELSASITALGGFANPDERCCVVLWYALSTVEHHSEVELGQSMVLISSLAVPFGGLRKILRETRACAVFQTKAELGVCVSPASPCQGDLQTGFRSLAE